MKNIKQIAFVSDAIYPFNKGGKEKRTYDITTRLAAEGYDVTIYCMQWWEGEKTIVRDGVKLHAISPYYPLYAGNRRSIKEAIFFSLHCLKLLGKKFDVIEIDHMPHLVLFATKLVCLLKRKRMVVVWHEVWGLEYWKQYLGLTGILAYWVEKISAMLPDTIIAVSDNTAVALRNVLKTKRRIVVVPNGLDIESIDKILPAGSGADIIFAGRLLAHKNIDVLLRAIRIVAEDMPGISALIIGNGPERKNLETLADTLGIGRNVSFRDFFEHHDELYGAMKASKIFVLPSTREGFGIVVPEANACNLPVVTIDSEQNGARALIVEGQNGLLSALNERQLADSIKKAFVMKKDKDAYAQYAEKYDWGAIVPKLEIIYGI